MEAPTSSEWAVHARVLGNTCALASREPFYFELYSLVQSQNPNSLGVKMACTFDPSTWEDVCEFETSQACMVRPRLKNKIT